MLVTASTSPPTPVRVGGRSILSLPSGSWGIEKAVMGVSGRSRKIPPLPSLQAKGGVFVYPHAKSPIARLYGSYKGILRAELVVVVLAMILFVKYFETEHFKIIPDMV